MENGVTELSVPLMRKEAIISTDIPSHGGHIKQLALESESRAFGNSSALLNNTFTGCLLRERWKKNSKQKPSEHMQLSK